MHYVHSCSLVDHFRLVIGTPKNFRHRHTHQTVHSCGVNTGLFPSPIGKVLPSLYKGGVVSCACCCCAFVCHASLLMPCTTTVCTCRVVVAIARGLYNHYCDSHVPFFVPRSCRVHLGRFRVSEYSSVACAIRSHAHLLCHSTVIRVRFRLHFVAPFVHSIALLSITPYGAWSPLWSITPLRSCALSCTCTPPRSYDQIIGILFYNFIFCS